MTVKVYSYITHSQHLGTFVQHIQVVLCTMATTCELFSMICITCRFNYRNDLKFCF